MSLLGTINPNPRRSQSVVSHSFLPVSHDDSPTHVLPGDGSQQKGDIDTLQAEKVRRVSTVSYLARQLTRHSTRLSEKVIITNPFTVEDPGTTINPHSPDFKVKDWLRMLLAVKNHEPEKYPERTAGVAFRNLSVHEFGSPTEIPEKCSEHPARDWNRFPSASWT